MRLSLVPAGSRVRIVSKLIRWVEHSAEQRLADDVTWEGTVTDKTYFYKGHKRWLIVDHTIDWPEYGVWQKDTEVDVIPHEPNGYQSRQRRPGGLLMDK